MNRQYVIVMFSKSIKWTVVLLVAVGSVAADTDVSRALDKDGIVPEVIDKAPEALISVSSNGIKFN